MRVTISSEYHFCRSPDGDVWTDGPCHYEFLARYLAAFDHVNVVARVEQVATTPRNQRRADGQGVSFSPVPSYLGPWQYLRRSRAVRRAVRAAVGPRDAVILNAPGQIATCLEAALVAGRPYAIQVLGNPYDMLAPGVIRHPLRPALRWLLTRAVQRQARRACAALYVTRQALQTRYPCPRYMIGLSDVDLPPAAIAPTPRDGLSAAGPIRLITVGTMTQLQKGHDVLIDAVAECVRRGLDLRLALVGDGKHRPEFEAQVQRLGIADRVEFRGQLPAGELIRAELDAADLFVFPSRSEGLPRALIEAMARGLPCLASRVGGIPELLVEEDLLPPGDAPALAHAISAVLKDPARYRRMSNRNLETAGTYRAAALERQRVEFFRLVATRTAQWLDTKAEAKARRAAEVLSRALVSKEMSR